MQNVYLHIFIATKVTFITTPVEAHGRLMDPPARNAMWRFGFPNPVNYNDNELFCGGYAGNSILDALESHHK